MKRAVQSCEGTRPEFSSITTGAMATANDEDGTPVQIVSVNNKDHTFTLNEEALQDILKDVKDLPVVVISIAGTMRQGKSFLLSFFIRFLKAKGASNWLGDENLPLKGFSWRGGCEADTSGILMWSQPFQVQIPSGKTVGVLLMDTQGAFDNKSTVNDCATIFALSTLISSVQIFNIKELINENHLQNLQIFTEYGKLAMETSDQKPFQKLLFLVRDWTSAKDYKHGSEGGKNYIDKTLEINAEQHSELSDVRRSIRACFEDISCFLMPHPGLEVTSANFEGRIEDIRTEFVQTMSELAQELLAPEKLIVKSFIGQQIKAEQLSTFFREYMKVFQDGKTPQVHSIFNATAEAINLTAVMKAKELYRSTMEATFQRIRFSIEEIALREFHFDSERVALECFHQDSKFGGCKMTERWQGTLIQELQVLFNEFNQRNDNNRRIEETALHNAFTTSLQGYQKSLDEAFKAKIRYSREDQLNMNDELKKNAILQLKHLLKDSVGKASIATCASNLEEAINTFYIEVDNLIKLDREARNQIIENDFDYDPEAWRLYRFHESLSNAAEPFVYFQFAVPSVSGATAARILPTRFRLLNGNLGAHKHALGIKDLTNVNEKRWVLWKDRLDHDHTLPRPTAPTAVAGGLPGGLVAGQEKGAVTGQERGAAIGGAIGALFGGVGAISGAVIGDLIGTLAGGIRGGTTAPIVAETVADAVRENLTGRLLSYKCGTLELKPSYPPENSKHVDQWFKIVLDFITMVLNHREMFVLTWHDAEEIFIYDPLNYTIEKKDEMSYFKARMTRRSLKDACTSPQFLYSEMAFTSPTPNIADARKLRGSTKKQVLEGNVNVGNEYLCMANDGGSLFWLKPAMTFENVKSVLKKNGSDILVSD